MGPEKPNMIYRRFMRVDSWISTALFETGQAIKRGWLAYSSFLERFRVKGLNRAVVDVADDAATFGTVFAVGLLMYALPPISETGDVWNRNREYAVTFTDISGEIIGHRGVRQDDAVPIEEIPKHVVQAVMATEDSRFFQHFGLDIQGTMRAMVANAKAQGVVQGGSTLTQQLAKNLFLSPERTLRRKVHEAFLALWIEARLPKEQILKMYLDRSYMGGGNYGVEAASQFYFGKSIRDVGLQEAAMLAGLFKAPSKYAPHINVDAARDRANVVLGRMLEVGYISQGELIEARRNPAEIVSQSDYYSPDYFLDYAYKETLQLIEERGLTQDYVIEVKTTVDIRLQKAAQKVVNDILEKEAKWFRASQGALVSLAPDGAVAAIVGGKDYEDSQFNRATDALRQPGSSFKPFVYLAALRKGMTPKSIVRDGPITIRGWSPRNYSNRYYGRTTLARALARSFNTVPVHLMQAIGRKAIIETAQMTGVQSRLLAVPSLPLGSNEMTVLDITGGYTAFANGGLRAPPYAVLEIQRPSGEIIYDRKKNGAKPKRIFAEREIADLNFMLNQVVMNGTARRAQIGFTPQAGKTGTTSGYRDAWFVGFTSHFVTGVWFGNDDYSPTKRATGGSIPAMAWKRFNIIAHRNKSAAALPGIPLDGRYRQYIVENQGSENVPQAASPEDGLRTSALIEDESGDSEDEVARANQRSQAVVRVLHGMFSSFNKPKVRRARRRNFNTGFRSRRSGFRARSNARRLRNLLQNR